MCLLYLWKPVKKMIKSNKAPVSNATCSQWMETLSGFLWIPQDDSSNELEEILLKLVISMGSAMSGILGESVVNMASYKRSNVFSPVTLPLKNAIMTPFYRFKFRA